MSKKTRQNIYNWKTKQLSGVHCSIKDLLRPQKSSTALQFFINGFATLFISHIFTINNTQHMKTEKKK
jgi:hypothetical protein